MLKIIFYFFWKLVYCKENQELVDDEGCTEIYFFQIRLVFKKRKKNRIDQVKNNKPMVFLRLG